MAPRRCAPSTSTEGFVIDGRRILGTEVLEYVLHLGVVPGAAFDADALQDVVERFRLLLGWGAIEFALDDWVVRSIRDPFFVNAGTEWEPHWALRPNADGSHVPDGVFRFACWIALKHGPSYARVTANEIFDWVTRLGSDLPARLKKHGSGDLPPELATFRGEGVKATANDAFAIVRITVTQEKEDAYAQALDYLVRLLTATGFPRSYAIEFRGPTKTYLPVKGLSKKGVHQLFAAAAAYPALHPAIAAYARAAMTENAWYQNLDDIDTAMPGTFAVFALAFTDTGYADLVLDYLALVDGEHQSMHGKLVEAYLDARGFTTEAVAYFVACAHNIQDLPHRKRYTSLIADPDAVRALRDARGRAPAGEPPGVIALQASLRGEPVADYAWRLVRHAIWGDAAEPRDKTGRLGGSVIAAASAELRPLYEEIFADEP